MVICLETNAILLTDAGIRSLTLDGVINISTAFIRFISQDVCFTDDLKIQAVALHW